MRAPYHLLSVLPILATGPVDSLAAPLTRLWDAKKDWENLGHLAVDTTIDLYLALKPQHENALIDALLEVSTPERPKYGAHLSKEQVAQLVAPHSDTLNLVNTWLEDHGISPSSVSLTPGGNWLKVIGVPVLQANDILGASYQLYQHVKTNNTVLRTVSYSLPDVLHGHIQTVVPTTYFGSPRTQRKKPRFGPHGVPAARANAGLEELVTTPPNRGPVVTPSYLRWLYRISGYVPAAVDRNAIGIAGYMMQYPSPQDLKDFMTEFRTDGEDTTYTVLPVNDGGYDPSHPGIETNLDIQYAATVTYPTPAFYYITGGEETLPADSYVPWLAYVLEQENLPQIISTTYSGNEYEVPQEFAEGVCELFAKLGALGVSVLFSPGDWGVGDAGNCLVRGSSGDISVRFLPQFPASCPWVTSVGGTTSHDPEIAASLSGGGFSNYFPRPPYQAEAVPPFLQSIGNMYQGLFNPCGRGLPDIAAQAINVVVVLNGEYEVIDGTSGSTPMPGIISLLNDYRISKGKPPLGFLNPWLYGKALPGLNDITSGRNPGCGTDGLPAIIGWDPVTGLGTPDFTKLEEIIDEME
ncbi:subtilisin-like protein [Lactarius hatsudake]|nr:subtilisin-like protein [Lactarius hatsudake]